MAISLVEFFLVLCLYIFIYFFRRQPILYIVINVFHAWVFLWILQPLVYHFPVTFFISLSWSLATEASSSSDWASGKAISLWLFGDWWKRWMISRIHSIIYLYNVNMPWCASKLGKSECSKVQGFEWLSKCDTPCDFQMWHTLWKGDLQAPSHRLPCSA